MEVKAKAKFIKMSPKKVRLVIDVVRGMKVQESLDQLKFMNKWASRPVEKLVNSAVANAKNNFELDVDNLYIKEVRVDEGPTIHRWMPKAHGRATPIRKKMSHIILVLGEIKDSGVKEAKKQKIEEPIKLDHEPKKEGSVKIKEDVKNNKVKAEAKEEKGKKIVDVREEGHGKHTKVEGASNRGLVGKVFRRKSG
jgi:large subunit ribosomal protein L22